MTDLTISIILVLLVLVILDGLRRKWNERRNRVVMKIDKTQSSTTNDEEFFKAELPNGGARTLGRQQGAQSPVAKPKPSPSTAPSRTQLKPQDVPMLMDAVELEEESIEHTNVFADSSSLSAEDSNDYTDDDVSSVRSRDRSDIDEDEEWDEEDDFSDDEVSSEHEEFEPAAQDETYDDEDFDDEEFDDESFDTEEDEFESIPPKAKTASPPIEDYSEIDAWEDEQDEEEQSDEDWIDDDYEDTTDEEDDYENESPVRKEAKAASYGSRGEGRIEPVFGEEELDHYEFSDDFDPELSNEQEQTRHLSRTPKAAQSDRKSVFGGGFLSKKDQGELFREENKKAEVDSVVEEAGPQEVIIINVMAKPGELFEGYELLPVLQLQGLRLGDMSIFHKHSGSNGTGTVLYSMANMVTPGIFDLASMETFKTPGVSFFLQLPNKYGNMVSFDQMLTAANAIKHSLGGELKDENRSVFTRQTMEHYRQRIRDFELTMLSRK